MESDRRLLATAEGGAHLEDDARVASYRDDPTMPDSAIDDDEREPLVPATAHRNFAAQGEDEEENDDDDAASSGFLSSLKSSAVWVKYRSVRYALSVVAFLAICMLGFYYVLLPAIIRHSIERTDVRLEHIKMVDTFDVDIDMNTRLTVQTPIAWSVKLDPIRQVNIHVNGTRLGYMNLPAIAFQRGNDPVQLDFVSNFRFTNFEALSALTSSATRGDHPQSVSLLGSVTVKPYAWPFSIKDVSFEKKIVLPPPGSTPVVELVSFKLDETSPAKGIDLVVEATINNAIPIEMDIPHARFRVFYRGVAVGTMETHKAIRVVQGKVPVEMVGELKAQHDPEHVKVVAELFAKYLNGEPFILGIKGSANDVSLPMWMRIVIDAIDLEVTVQPNLLWKKQYQTVPLANSSSALSALPMAAALLKSGASHDKRARLIMDDLVKGRQEYLASWGRTAFMAEHGLPSALASSGPLPFDVAYNGHIIGYAEIRLPEDQHSGRHEPNSSMDVMMLLFKVTKTDVALKQEAISRYICGAEVNVTLHKRPTAIHGQHVDASIQTAIPDEIASVMVASQAADSPFLHEIKLSADENSDAEGLGRLWPSVFFAVTNPFNIPFTISAVENLNIFRQAEDPADEILITVIEEPELSPPFEFPPQALTWTQRGLKMPYQGSILNALKLLRELFANSNTVYTRVSGDVLMKIGEFEHYVALYQRDIKLVYKPFAAGSSSA